MRASDQMTAAVDEAEAAAQMMATAYTNFDRALNTAKHDRARELGSQRVSDLDNACSTAHLDRLIAGRLRALGLEQVLAHAPGAVDAHGPDAVTKFKAAIRANVP